MSYTLIIFPTPLDARCELRPDEGGEILGVPVVHPTGRPGQGFTIPAGTGNGHGAQLSITAPGKAPLRQRAILFLNDGTLLYPWTPGQTAAFAADDFVLQPASSSSLPLEALHLQGRQGFHTPAGVHVPLTGATGFQLVELVYAGNEAAAVAFLQAMKPARTIRVLTMAQHLFHLAPDAGRLALRRTLDLARAHGMYLSVVACADTKSYAFNIEQHVADVGAICAASPACAFLELGNELFPLHSTQDSRLGDLAFLKQLRALVPASVPVSLGSTHGDQDESDIFKDGDLLTVHGDRSDDGTGWRFVRHTNEQRVLAEKTHKYVVNDEPRRDDLAPDKHLGLALLCRMFRIGDTFHFGSGLQCRPPLGAEVPAFEARARGWVLISDDWNGQYFNAGFVGSPVKSFSGAVRVYSSASGAIAYTLAIGAGGTLEVDWSPDWPTRTLIASEGGVRLWSVTK